MAAGEQRPVEVRYEGRTEVRLSPEERKEWAERILALWINKVLPKDGTREELIQPLHKIRDQVCRYWNRNPREYMLRSIFLHYDREMESRLIDAFMPIILDARLKGYI